MSLSWLRSSCLILYCIIILVRVMLAYTPRGMHAWM